MLKVTMQKESKAYIRKFALLFIVGYLIYQIMTGDRGFLKLIQLSKKHHALENEITTLETKKQTLAQKVQMLKPESLNLDMLDEQVRRRLGYTTEGETVFVEKQD